MGGVLDPTQGEQHNAVVEDGRVRVRAGLATHYTLAGATGRIVAAFSVPNPRTTEVWHYLFRQAPTGAVTLDVVTEEYTTVYSVDCGAMQADPVISWGVVNNQLMVSSPSFSVTLYGVVGQGLFPALKTVAPDPRLTTIDVPVGHLCTWRNRIVIAAGNIVYVNSGEVDPRTFPAPNFISFAGQVLDVLEGPDGGLWVFTTRDVHVVPVDALSASQISAPFIATVPNVGTSQPRNAVATCGVILALAPDGIVQLTTSSQHKTDVSPYEGRRYFTPEVRVRDLRTCRIFRTTNGAVISFGAQAPVFLVVDLRNAFRSYWWTQATAGGAFDTRNVVGTLRTRDNATLFVLSPPTADGTTASIVVENIGNLVPGGLRDTMRAFVCIRSALPADSSPVLRFITVDADNPGGSTFVFAAGTNSTVATPTGAAEALVGTSTWSATVPLAERDKRTMRHAFAARVHDLEIEIGVDGAGSSFDPGNLLARGQGKTRATRS